MAYPDLEDAVEAVRLFFMDNFQGKLQEIDESKANPLYPSVPDSQAYYFGDMPVMSLYPCLVFVGDSSKVVKEEYGYREQLYSCFIEGYLAADDVQKTSRMMRRYGAAIDELLEKNFTVAGACKNQIKNVTNISQRYWATLKRQTGLFQAVRVSFDLRVITD